MATIGLVSDIHMEAHNRETVQEHLDQAVAEFRQAAVDAVVAAGDFVTYSETADEDRAFIRDIVDRLEAAGVPLFTLPGNHDVVNLSRAQLCGLLGQEPYRTATIAEQDIVLLDSADPDSAGSRGALGERQRDWLAETLPGVTDAIVFVHHPVHYHDVSDSPWWDEYPERAFCGDKKEVGKKLADSPNVRTVINAHLHDHDRTIQDGIPHITLEPFARKHPGDGVTGAHAILDTATGTLTMRTPGTEIISYDI